MYSIIIKKMETLIVKENWKEPIKRSRKILIVFLIIFFLIGLGAAILSFLNGNNLVASLTILFAIGLVVPLSFIVFLSPIYLVKIPQQRQDNLHCDSNP